MTSSLLPLPQHTLPPSAGMRGVSFEEDLMETKRFLGVLLSVPEFRFSMKGVKNYNNNSPGMYHVLRNELSKFITSINNPARMAQLHTMISTKSDKDVFDYVETRLLEIQQGLKAIQVMNNGHLSVYHHCHLHVNGLMGPMGPPGVPAPVTLFSTSLPLSKL